MKELMSELSYLAGKVDAKLLGAVFIVGHIYLWSAVL